jgi:uncharacterized protein
MTTRTAHKVTSTKKYDFDCQSCGACCFYSAEWPRFSLESDAEIEAIPEAHRADSGYGMRCDGNRCTALSGTVGTWTACTVYAVRPIVCRECVPGDDACLTARRYYNFPV